jgi:hypothetical protein
MGIIVASAAIKSVAQEPIKHGINALGTGTGVIAAHDELELVIAIVGLCVSLGIGFKTYLGIRNELEDLRIKKVQLANEGRREADK